MPYVVVIIENIKYIKFNDLLYKFNQWFKRLASPNLPTFFYDFKKWALFLYITHECMCVMSV